MRNRFNRYNESELFDKTCQDIIDELNESYDNFKYTPSYNTLDDINKFSKENLLKMFDHEINKKQYHINILEFKIRNLKNELTCAQISSDNTRYLLYTVIFCGIFILCVFFCLFIKL